MIVLGMSKHEDFRRPEKPLEETREIDNQASISEKAETKRKLYRNQKRITLWDIQLSSLTFLFTLKISTTFADLLMEKKQVINLL